MSSVVILTVGLIKFFDRMGIPQVPKSFSNGEQLSVASLRAGERIEVTLIFYPDRGDAYGRRYRIEGGNQRLFSATDLEVDWRGGVLESKLGRVLASFNLTIDESEGVDLALSYLRRAREEEYGTARYEYRVLFFRGKALVGETFVASDHLLSELGYADRQRRRGNPGVRDLGKLALEAGISLTEVQRMKAFQVLEHEGLRDDR